jgi:adenosylcobinamide kinase/adenosylcobinamide-phosphate guanylyltransferase
MLAPAMLAPPMLAPAMLAPAMLAPAVLPRRCCPRERLDWARHHRAGISPRRASRRYNRAMTTPDLTFVLGGARSGKSRFAESIAEGAGTYAEGLSGRAGLEPGVEPAAGAALALAAGHAPEPVGRLAARHAARPVTYIATARPADDAEFAERIAHHRARRPAHWRVVEADADLARAIVEADDGRTCIVVDCLTLWLVGLIAPAGGEAAALAPDELAARVDALETALAQARGPVIVVSNEIGMGVVPLGALTRRYIDELGRLNQRIAALAREVTLMVAGLPVAVKRGAAR